MDDARHLQRSGESHDAGVIPAAIEQCVASGTEYPDMIGPLVPAGFAPCAIASMLGAMCDIKYAGFATRFARPWGSWILPKEAEYVVVVGCFPLRRGVVLAHLAGVALIEAGPTVPSPLDCTFFRAGTHVLTGSCLRHEVLPAMPTVATDLHEIWARLPVPLNRPAIITVEMLWPDAREGFAAEQAVLVTRTLHA